MTGLTGAAPSVINANERVDVASAIAKRKFVRAEMRSAEVVAAVFGPRHLFQACAGRPRLPSSPAPAGRARSVSPHGGLTVRPSRGPARVGG